MKVQSPPAAGMRVTMSGSKITFTANGQNYKIEVPDSFVDLKPSTTSATVTFSNGNWHLYGPERFSGNVFLNAVEFRVPVALRGVQNVTWTASFTSTDRTAIQWQWAAAAYSSFSTDYNALGVKPLDQPSGTAYPNSDAAGTPENFKAYVVGGARGGGGSNFTGSLSGTVAVTPCPCSVAP